MSSGCGDVLSLEDLKTAKQHQVFEAEVITGLSGGVPGGTTIDYATNPVTGQVQKTLPAVLRDAGFRPAPFTFVTGGTLAVGDSDRAVLWPVSSGGDGNYYVWKGAYPKVIPAASSPATTGGVSSSGWMPAGDITLRPELASSAVNKGDALITVKQPYAGSSPRTQHDKNADFISVKDSLVTGDGITDVTVELQKVLDSGRSVYFPDGDYIASSLTLSSDNVSIFGPGRIIKKAGVNGRLLTITGSGCSVSDLKFNGRNAAPNQMHYNNIIHITGDNNTVSGCFIDGSQGGGITIEGAANNKIINNTIIDTYDNNIHITDEGANRNMVSGNICRGTVAQNNIFVTASADSSANGKFVYDNIIIGNSCADSADTGIEAGYHTIRTIIKGNICLNSYNPGILLRDNFGSIVDGNIIAVKAYASQHANYDGIAIAPQNEGAGNYSATIVNNTILGPTKRSGVYVGGSWVKVSNNTIYDNQSAINAAGDGLVGDGILLANGVSDIDISNNFVRRKKVSIDMNYPGSPTAAIRINICNNTLMESETVVNGYKVTFDKCMIHGNIVSFVKNAVVNFSDALINGGLKYINNDISLSGFTGVTPQEFLPDTIVQSSCLITDSKTKVFDLPTTQGGYVILSSAGMNSIGICTVQFADGTQSGVFAIGGKPGSGDGTVVKITGTNKIFGSDRSGTFDGWVIHYKSDTSDLILEKRDSTPEPSSRKARIMISDL
nr:MAG TPA: tailspike protein [Caudoviricetes sp.]